MELVTTFQLSQVLQISPQAVRKRLDAVERDRDAAGLVAWRRDLLPADWQRKLELVCRIKGCDSVAEILSCQQIVAKQFEFSIEHATTHEKKMWPLRKDAVLEYFRAIDAGCKKAVAERRARELFEQLSTTPVSARNIRRWVKVVDRCGGPQHAPDEAYVLWGKRRTLPGPPRETIEYFNERIARNQRTFSGAWKTFVAQWRNWRSTGDRQYAIPGYTECPPPAPGRDLPLRWSYHYFISKRRRPSPIVIAGARYGDAEMRELAAVVRSTRVGVRVGEIVQFDDQVYDVKVNLLGINTRATKPLGLDALDLASSCCFSAIFKPTVYDDEERARKMLKLRDMIWFVVHVLTTYGWREDTGSTWYVEHGTAAIPEWLEENITKLTNGKVKIRRSGVAGRAPFEGVFDGPCKGNPRHKALLEGFRNPLRNLMADQLTFPGATGHDRHEPGDITGRDQYNKHYLKAWQALRDRDREDLAEQLVGPFLDWRLFPTLALGVIDAINNDIEHECEGWVESGYTVQEFRWSEQEPWLPMRNILRIEDPNRRDAAVALLEASPGLTRTRRLSRREVWNREADQLRKLPMFLIPQLLTHHKVTTPFGVLRPVTDKGEFEFQDKDANPYGGDFVFSAKVIDRSGHEIRLIPGLKYLTYLNPLDPSVLLVAEANGSYLGACPASRPAAANDGAATGALMVEHNKLLAAGRTDLAQLGIERTREMQRMKMHNEGVAAIALGTDTKTERKQQMEAATHALADLYADA